MLGDKFGLREIIGNTLEKAKEVTLEKAAVAEKAIVPVRAVVTAATTAATTATTVKIVEAIKSATAITAATADVAKKALKTTNSKVVKVLGPTGNIEEIKHTEIEMPKEPEMGGNSKIYSLESFMDD